MLASLRPVAWHAVAKGSRWLASGAERFVDKIGNAICYLTE
jgi:hypothetical protein